MAGNVQVVYITIRWNRTAVSSVILSLCKFEKSTRLNILKIELTKLAHTQLRGEHFAKPMKSGILPRMNTM